MLGGPGPTSVPFVLSENRARRGSDLPINPEAGPYAELRGEARARGVAVERGQRAATSAEGGGGVGHGGGRGAGDGAALALINKPGYQRRSESHSLRCSLVD